MPSISLSEAETPFAVAIDIGSSSVRALLFDIAGRDIDDSEVQLSYSLTTTADGGVEMRAEELLELVCECLDGVTRLAGSRQGSLGAVGISCFWHGLLGLDAQGVPVTPVFYYSDTRAGDDAEALRQVVDNAKQRQRTGCVIHSSYWPAKLKWLFRTRRDQVARVAKWLSVADYITGELVGSSGTSVSMASGTGMMVQQSESWDQELIAATGVRPESLPEIVPQSTRWSGISPAFHDRWPELVDVPWFLGLGDGACANVGCGATDRTRIALTIGTTGAMRIIVPAPIDVPFTIPDDLWCYRLDEGRIVLGAAISNGGKLLAWLNVLLSTNHEGSAVLEAAELAPDSHGLTMLPFLAGERSPIWNDHATGVIAGLTMATSQSDLIRAATESVGLRFARLYPSLKAAAEPNHTIVCSGAAILNNALLKQIIADSLEHSLQMLPPLEESSARGAAVMALCSAGLIDSLEATVDPLLSATEVLPIPANRDAYARALERQTTLETLLFPAGVAWDDDLRA